jgi:hypothetical protein
MFTPAASERISVLVFSRDRAMQLDAALRSLWLHCADFERVAVRVLYACSSALHRQQYEELRAEYRSYPNLRFLSQRHFWRDTLDWAVQNADFQTKARPGNGRGLVVTDNLYRRLLHLGHRFSFIRASLLRFSRQSYLLFLVDDNLFVRNFRLADACGALSRSPLALGFSLRLGTNTTYCYPMDQPQKLPPFTAEGPGILAFDWTSGELDFGYPLEVSSSIYRIGDLLPFLDGQPFANPNQLETRLAENSHRFRSRPLMLCFVRSVTFSNPVNKVNETYQNRAGEVHTYSSRLLAEKFAAGERIDVAAYSGMTPHACHQEAPLHFIPREGALVD